jgi:outer membrane protein TolC
MTSLLRCVLAATLAQTAAAALGPALTAQSADPVPVVTLTEARRMAMGVDPVTLTARAEMSAAAWERRAAIADLITPNISASTTYIRLSEPFFNFGTGDISANATSAVLEASYSVFGAGKVAELRRSNASLVSAEANQEAARFRTSLATDAVYYQVLAEHELARVAAERLQRAREQLGVARVRVQAGETIATDSLQLLLEVNRARMDVLRRDSALAVTRLRLGRQIGLSGPSDAVPLDTAVPLPLPVTLDQAVAELRERGPEVEAARAMERRAGAGVAAQRDGYLPDIILTATAGAYDAQFFPSAAKRSQFAITISLPIWDGGQRELAMARARADRDIAQAVREDRERGAAEEMAQAYNGYETARVGIELALVGVSAWAESYRVQGARYREGATTILDLLEAQVGLSEAEATLVQSRYAARLALAQIEALLGRRLFDGRD